MGLSPSRCNSAGEQPKDGFLCGACRCEAHGTQEDALDADAPVLFLSSEGLDLAGDALVPPVSRRGSSRKSSRNSGGALGPQATSRKSSKNSNGSRRGSIASTTAVTATSFASEPISHQVSERRAAVGESGQPDPGALTLNRLLLLPTIQKKLRRFRESMERQAPPTEEEAARGVHLQRTYDFYDCAARKMRVRKMFADVLHTRETGEPEMEHEASDSTDGGASTGSSSSSSTTRTPSERSLSDGAGAPAPAPCGARREGRAPDQEKVVLWGVLVGRLLHQELAVADSMCDTSSMVRRLSLDSTGARKGRRRELDTSLVARARSVVVRAKAMTQTILEEEEDTLDRQWSRDEDAALLTQLFGEDYLDTLILLANAARKTVAQQPVLANVEPPCQIFGDLHGQLRDMLYLFGAFDFPSCGSSKSFIFNGDFVDRGKHQVSTLGVLLALKVLLPGKVWLIRGNHEDKTMNEKYGFQEECHRLFGADFGPKCYETFHKVFDQLPVACLVSDRILVLHGGIGDGSWTLRDLRAIRRPLTANELVANRWILDLLWSDPIEEDDDSKKRVFGVHPSPRGNMGLCFAWDLTRQFCARNGLGLIVRSHQSKHGSLGFDIMHDNMLARVFSARDYEEHGNDGAVLLVQRSDCGQLLTVRPQVLRSVTKAVDEAIVRQMDSQPKTSKGQPSRRQTAALLRGTRRREAIFRRARANRGPSGGSEEPAVQGWLWRLKENGHRMQSRDWLWEEHTLRRNGGLTSTGDKDAGPGLVLLEACKLQGARASRVTSHQAIRPNAFQIIFQGPDGGVSRLLLAAESPPMRDTWLRELRKFASG
mmetsp:Transcript_1743/g.5491  ORF Transcript_1743/g.5491 Transcript_1743/m.5491 type:complete len:825 (-) Transcript_1743:204-2678(-)